MANAEHWENVYRTKEANAVSWYRSHLDRSLAMVDACGLGPNAHVVDIGGGASTLVDDLLARGFSRIAVLDLAGSALEVAQRRLGDRAASVRWIVGDAAARHFDEASVDLWHDRAVFHFLTDEGSRAAYLAELERAVRPGGFVILATFALDGPEKCSGLPVRRHDAAGLADALGPAFEVLEDAREAHVTPWGATQNFVYVRARKH
jgi:ubiquinone/menaquinone biosynthesis C-methylase UbiE